ncbi:MAG: hypothetical protein GTO14_07270 [Anaerolineales bacterium]|nr:hypothetical protein [Anaerolineales bacterium]
MTRSKTIRLLGICFAVGGALVALSLSYFGLTSPSLPYSKLALYTVDQLTDSARSGDIQPGDEILSFNNEPFFGCMYLADSPIYRAPRDTPIPVEYNRPSTNTHGITDIVLADPSPQTVLNRSLTHLIAFSFVVSGIIILVGGSQQRTDFLLGLASLASGLVIAAGPDISDFHAPLSMFYWLGIPVWSILLVASHTFWPINQINRPIPRLLLIVIGLTSFAHFSVNIVSSTWLGCSQNEIIFGLGGWSYLLNIALPFPMVLYLLSSAYRLTDNPFSRLQIRAIAWAVGLGFGIPLLFSIVPLYLGIHWVAPIETTLLISGIIPLTYLYALYRGELLLIDRYLNRVVFTALFLIFWGATTLVTVNVLTYWIPDPNPLLVSAFAAIPPLLLATFVRERLGLLVDLALYGVYYNPEQIISQIGQELAGALTEDSLADIVVHRLPQALSIRHAALWMSVNSGKLRLIRHSEPGKVPESELTMPLDAFPTGNNEVDMLNTSFNLGSDPTPWRTLVRLRRGDEELGILLLGEKIREQSYSEKDIRTLGVLASWMSTTLANIGHITRERTVAERERRLILALVENEEKIRAEVAAELHDQGISALGMARLMVEQERGKSIIAASIERVIDNLRELSANRLSPAGLDQGLHHALEAMVDAQRELGVMVSLDIAEDYLKSGRLSPLIERELFYIAQEAVVNASKHAEADTIRVILSRSNNTLVLAIRDNGRGFNVAAAVEGRETRGMGIMQARANRIGGKLTLTSEPGQLTEVLVEVKIDRYEKGQTP